MNRIIKILSVILSFHINFLNAQSLEVDTIFYKKDSTYLIELIEVYFKYTFVSDTIITVTKANNNKLKNKQYFNLGEISGLYFSSEKIFHLKDGTLINDGHQSMTNCTREKEKKYKAKKNEIIIFKAQAYTNRFILNDHLEIDNKPIPISIIKSIELLIEEHPNKGRPPLSVILPFPPR
ncbi:MAG: hypothetical protein V4667_09105 [Bacteroidota bacterium]